MNILESIRIGPRRVLNPRPLDHEAPTVPTLPSDYVIGANFVQDQSMSR